MANPSVGHAQVPRPDASRARWMATNDEDIVTRPRAGAPDDPTTPTSGFPRRSFLKGAAAGLGLSMMSAAPAAASPLSGLSGLLGGATSRVLGATDVLRMARVRVADAEQAAFVLGNFDDTHRIFDDGSLEVLLWPGDLARLRASGLRYDITVEDVIARDERAMAFADDQTHADGRLPGQRDGYRTLADYEGDLLALVARFPESARLITLPERTLEGRTVLGIEIADDVDRLDHRPVWYMDGLHHAREWPSGECTIMFAFELLENPTGDERIDALRAGTRTILVPVVNPDGFSWSRDALVQVSDPNASLPLAIAGLEAYWRKNRRGLIDQAVLPVIDRNVTAYGVDPNRNYSARWGGPGASGEPVLQDHRGSAPFSEPEARNVAALLRQRQPIGVHSNHTYTGLVLRPWGHSGGEGRFSPDEDVMRDLGAHMARDSGYRNIHSFDLYVTTGTTTDWAYAALGSLSFCLELGLTNFHPPYDGSDGALNSYVDNREALLILGETALYQHLALEPWDIDSREFTGADPVPYATHARIDGQVVDGAGQPLPAELRVSRTTRIPLGAAADEEFYTEASEAVGATHGDGTFSWALPPSTTPTAMEREEVEAWQLEIVAGDHREVREVVVDRGETAQLGTIQLGEPTRDGAPPWRGRPPHASEPGRRPETAPVRGPR